MESWQRRIFEDRQVGEVVRRLCVPIDLGDSLVRYWKNAGGVEIGDSPAAIEMTCRISLRDEPGSGADGKLLPATLSSLQGNFL